MHPDRFAALSRSLGDSTSRRGLLRLLGVGVAGTAILIILVILLLTGNLSF